MTDFRLTASACLLLVAALSGCENEGEGVVPVTGVVLLDGEPLTTGAVVTTPEKGPGARGVIAGDGTFALQTRGVGEGALQGVHHVAVIARAASEVGNPEARSRSLIPEQYSNPYSSGIVLDVVPGGVSDFKIELFSKAEKRQRARGRSSNN